MVRQRGRPEGGSAHLRGPILDAADRAIEESDDGRIRVPRIAKELGIPASTVRYHLYNSGMRDICRRIGKPSRDPLGPPVPLLPLEVIWARAERVRVMPAPKRDPARRPKWSPYLEPADACRIMLDEWRELRKGRHGKVDDRPSDRRGTPDALGPGLCEGERCQADDGPPLQ